MDIGTKAPHFSLTNIDGNTYELQDFFDAPVLVVVFTCNHCPYAQAYDDRLKALAADYKGKVQVVMINSNDSKHYPEDSFEAMQKAHEAKEFAFPYLHDHTQEVAKAYNAECTPHTFVFDKERELVYEGAIDDNWKEEELVVEEHVREAVDAALKGAKPEKEKVAPLGCSIKWKR
ncbi:thioredoxin family protein [Candidatus Woesearchaeota archaeon]|nr:thioredoxin family protein [Candidatus Woesearchaeota archaeon]